MHPVHLGPVNRAPVVAEREARAVVPSPIPCEILERPDNKRPYVLFPVGDPAADAGVPDIDKKPLDNIVQRNR